MGNFKNLLGTLEREKYIENELKSFHVQPKYNKKSLFSLTGSLGGFKFFRGSNYWLCVGGVPLVIAEKLYNDGLGYSSVLVVGNLTRPSPTMRRTEDFRKSGRVLARKGDYVWAINNPSLGWVIPHYTVLNYAAMMLYLSTLRDAQLID